MGRGGSIKFFNPLDQEICIQRGGDSQFLQSSRPGNPHHSVPLAGESNIRVVGGGGGGLRWVGGEMITVSLNADSNICLIKLQKKKKMFQTSVFCSLHKTFQKFFPV